MIQTFNPNNAELTGLTPSGEAGNLAGQLPLDGLTDLFNEDRLAPSYVLYGQETALIYKQAFQLAAYILAQTPKNPYGFSLESTTKFLAQNTHPNFFLLTPSESGKDILIENARDLTAFLQKTPAIPGWRVIIINPADRLNNAAGNALLKSIEELPAQTTIFLIAGGLARVKATILSRSQKIFFPTHRYSTEDYIRLFSQPVEDGAERPQTGEKPGEKPGERTGIKAKTGTRAKSPAPAPAPQPAPHLGPKVIIAAIDKALHEHKIDKPCVEAIIINDESVALFKKIVLAHLYELAEGKARDLSRLYVNKYEQISRFISSTENKALPQAFIVNAIFFKIHS
jgi:hypothetical protein